MPMGVGLPVRGLCPQGFAQVMGVWERGVKTLWVCPEWVKDWNSGRVIFQHRGVTRRRVTPP